MHLHSVITTLLLANSTPIFLELNPLVPFAESFALLQPEKKIDSKLGAGLIPGGPSTPTRSYESPLEAAVRSGDKETVLAALDGHPWFGSSLIVAAECGYKGIAELLIDKGASLDNAPGDSGTALIVAAKAGNLNIMRLLLAKGASADIRPRSRGTALRLRLRPKTYEQ